METTKSMHRLAKVRQLRNVSLYEVAQRLHTSIDHIIRQETETYDLFLSELWAWQDVLDVPIGDLLIDRASSLQGPVLDRSQLHKLSKNASHIRDLAPNPRVQRLAKLLVSQLQELMPEENS